ncbi:hypothetical protein JTE90_001058 [Oedothorax gibbosus]|uniref:Uncharacterized protein n=1 Tax=Oedothorax gibbosus TaxID=931172 RepID=A0AAV6TFP3_9ARAC|nr:hypothetical protein JTE90_001058 [Oedothorax gibbosus]
MDQNKNNLSQPNSQSEDKSVYRQYVGCFNNVQHPDSVLKSFNDDVWPPAHRTQRVGSRAKDAQNRRPGECSGTGCLVARVACHSWKMYTPALKLPTEARRYETVRYRCIGTRRDSDLEAFSHNPNGGKLRTTGLSAQAPEPSVRTCGSSSRHSEQDYYATTRSSVG